jgi:hypothetical protein
MTEPKPEIAPRIENGDALCVTSCPRLTIADGKILSACATTAQYGGYCGPWYREQVAALRRQRDERTAELEQVHDKQAALDVALAYHDRMMERMDEMETLMNAQTEAIEAQTAAMKTVAAERDAARRELMAQFANVGFNVREVVMVRGWGYLYETPEGGEG